MSDSKQISIFGRVRVAGSPIYYPAYTNPATGRLVNARCEVVLFVNESYIDRQTGQRIQKSDSFPFAFWNGDNAKPGKGAADNAAKYLYPGKEIDIDGKIESYMGKVYDEQGNARLDAAGQPITTKKYRFKAIPGSLNYGSDGNKQIQMEIAQWDGALSFYGRPAHWNVENTADAKQWGEVRAWRSAQVYQQGSPTFGYATVRANGVATQPAQPAQPAQQVYPQQQQQTYAGQPAYPGQPAATAPANMATGYVNPNQPAAIPTPAPQPVYAHAGQPTGHVAQPVAY